MDTQKHTKNTTKQKIIDCFWSLYKEKGIDKITVSELTKLAMINRSTFYAHFKDVYDVLDTIEEAYLPGGEFFKHFHSSPDGNNMYRSFIEIFNRKYEKFSFLLSEHGDPNFIIKLKNRIRPAVKANFPKVYHESKYFDLSIEFAVSSTIHVITYWANHPNEISSEELFIYLHELLVHGIPHSLHLGSGCPTGNHK